MCSKMLKQIKLKVIIFLVAFEHKQQNTYFVYI